MITICNTSKTKGLQIILTTLFKYGRVGFVGLIVNIVIDGLISMGEIKIFKILANRIVTRRCNHIMLTNFFK